MSLLKSSADIDQNYRFVWLVCSTYVSGVFFLSRRNDVISTVREAAGIALKEIGGEEADKAIHMTKVLTEEIRILTLS
jgi:hypothetical protein